VVGGVQHGEQGVVALAVPDPAGQGRQPVAHHRLCGFGRATRIGQQQRAVCGGDGLRDALGQVGGVVGRQVEGGGGAAHHHRHAWMGQGGDARGEGGRRLGQSFARDAVGAAGDRQDVGAAEVVMGGGDDQVVAVVAPARILGLDDEGLAAAPVAHARRQGQAGAARGDPQVGPFGYRARIERTRRQHGGRLQGRGEPVEGGAPADLLDLDLGGGLHAAGRVDLDHVADLLGDQGAGDRRGDGDLAQLHVGLVFADDLIDAFFLGVLVHEGDGGAELDLVAGQFGHVDDLGAGQLVLDLGDRAFDPALTLLGGVTGRQGLADAGGRLGVIDGGRGVFQRRPHDGRQLVFGHAQGAGGVRRDAVDAVQQLGANLGAVRADGQLHVDAVGDDVVFDAALDGADRDHGALQRAGLAAAQGLQRDHDVRGHQDRIDPQVRRGAVGGDAVDGDVHAVRTGGGDAKRHADPARRRVGRDVEGQGVVRLGEARIEAVLHHGAGAEDAFLGRLGDQDQGARPVGLARLHLARRADQGGDVHVVAAGVHDGFFDAVGVDLTGGGGVGQARLLLDRQAVHVGADHHRGSRAVAQDGDHAGAADAGGDVIAQSAQFLRHAGRGLDLKARQFGVAVEMVEQGAEVGVVVRLDGGLQRSGVVRVLGDGGCGTGGQNGGQNGVVALDRADIQFAVADGGDALRGGQRAGRRGVVGDLHHQGRAADREAVGQGLLAVRGVEDQLDLAVLHGVDDVWTAFQHLLDQTDLKALFGQVAVGAAGGDDGEALRQQGLHRLDDEGLVGVAHRDESRALGRQDGAAAGLGLGEGAGEGGGQIGLALALPVQTHDLAGRAHFRAQNGVDPGEAGEGEDGFLDRDVVQFLVHQTKGRQRNPGHDLGGDGGDRLADGLGDEGRRAAGARVHFQHEDARVFAPWRWSGASARPPFRGAGRRAAWSRRCRPSGRRLPRYAPERRRRRRSRRRTGRRHPPRWRGSDSGRSARDRRPRRAWPRRRSGPDPRDRGRSSCRGRPGLGRDRLGVAVDHDALDADVVEGEGRVAAAVVELDALADAVGAAAQDDDLLAIRGGGLAGRDLAQGAGLIGRIHIGGGGGELGGAGVDALEHRAHVKGAAGLADLALGVAGQLGQARVGEALGLQLAEVGRLGRQALDADMAFGAHDVGDLAQEPRLIRTGGVDLLDRQAVAEGLGDDADAVRRRLAQGADHRGLDRGVVLGAGHAVDLDVVEADLAGLQAAQCLLHRFLEGAAHRHHLTHRLHLGGQARIGGRELLEGEARDLGDDVIDGRFERGRGQAAGDLVLQFVQGVADGQLGGDLGDREAGGLGSQRRGTRHARVHLDHHDAAGVRVDAELHVRATGIHADLAQHGDGGIAQALVFLVGQGLRRGHGDRVTGVHAHRVQVLDRADDDAVVRRIADHFHLEFLPAQHRLFHQHFGGRRQLQATADDVDQFFAV
uniref:NAD-specific glutamate dehydrogenase n=1 Tax=Parastrongyloides trichosuri TaxID=131310 RepID=A0A0N4ZAR3_PARTI